MPQRRIEKSGLKVATEFVDFIQIEALPGTGISPDVFWRALADIVDQMGPQNREFLQIRADLQGQIDDWHRARQGVAHDPAAYESFLRDIGYIEPSGAPFRIDTENVDAEISTIAGPQLVVPVTNARFALNAANARWGSLYDALYGSDALGDAPSAAAFDPARGARVIEWARAHLDKVAPLAGGDWSGVTCLRTDAGLLLADNQAGETGLADPAQFAGEQRAPDGTLKAIILRVNGLHIQILFDASNPISGLDHAGISDIYLESAISAIIDCEDSVAAVDAADKVVAYRNWLGLMKGDMCETFSKGGRSVTRCLNPDIEYLSAQGTAATLSGRALMLVRNVGHLMTCPAVLDRDDREIGEGLLDGLVTVLIAMHDLQKSGGSRNSATGSIYVVKPKMHGAVEVGFADALFSRIESALGLPQYTVKLGVMDEERRTSINLGECIRAARHRLAFINTGFLDRTGDEIHTSMEAGVMTRKGDMQQSAWIKAYETRNVDIGLSCGLQGHAQIGKGMWAKPDLMADMLAQKITHPQAGANCAWVPSPTAATLHVTHYHQVDVAARQREIAKIGMRDSLANLLTLPLAAGEAWTAADIEAEIENNAQGILGYVVRWIDTGIGCSKVPDIHDVALMEDRATCRISSQALANWLHHGVVGLEQVNATMQKMAAIVDRQNADDPSYVDMAPSFNGIAYQTACDLVFKGRVQPSGYTEPLLHAHRLALKAALESTL